MKQIYKRAAAIGIILIFSTAFNSYNKTVRAQNTYYSEEELKFAIERLYNERSSAFVTGDPNMLEDNYECSRKQGLSAKEHEFKRIRYLGDWAASRGIKFTNAVSTVSIKKVSQEGELTKVALEETYKFNYIYPKDSASLINTFGVGIRHNLGLVRKGSTYVIAHDIYTDCFEDALKAYNSNMGATRVNSQPQLALNCRPRTFLYMPEKGIYNRLKAVEYADRFCGAARVEGISLGYNKRYMDYNGIGGDCTNFASQVIGDAEAGGLKNDARWFTSVDKSGRSVGTEAWINANGLRNYLIHSGKGMLVKQGTYKDLALPSPNFPNGAIDSLDLGDIICYAKGNTMDHFAVITGWDSNGYPLVNSHTTDRYHVPWDLGWGDNNIYFHLIHIK